MESYIENLVNTIGKVFILTDKNKTQEQITMAFKETLHGDRQQAANKMYEAISTLQRLPEAVKNREQERVNIIASLASDYKLQPRNVLDIGAGNGKITLAVKQHYGLARKDVYAIDTKLPSGLDLFPLMYKDGKIPLPDRSVDLILLFMVLHHVPPADRKNLLQEIARVLTPNGMLIIREHDDNKDPNLLAYIDLIHIFWYMLGEETIDPLYLLSKSELNDLMTSVGLKSFEKKEYTDYNPQEIYSEAFVPIVYPFRFADKAAQDAIQSYINKMKTRQDLNLVPVSVRGNKPWPTLLKESGVAILTQAAQLVPVQNGYRNITTAAIFAAVASIQQICPFE